MACPYKVALISHSYIESAYRRKLVYLAKSVNLKLITPSAYPTSYGWYDLDFEYNTGVNIQTYPIKFLHLKHSPTRWFLRTIDLGFQEFQPHIIHVEMEAHGWITCQALMCRKIFAPQAKVVIFSWDNLELGEQGPKAHTLEYLSRINRKFIDHIICGNIAGKDILLAKGVPADRISVIPQTGIDPDLFFPYSCEEKNILRRQLGMTAEEFVVGFVGQFVRHKGLLDLVEALGKLRATSSRRVVLALVGSGKLEQAIKLRCAELNLKLIVLPPQKYHRVPEAMNVMDVLVLPSRSTVFWKEQFGRVLIEAMACRIPVIGSNSGDIPNVIGNAGLIFREGDCLHLCESLRLCCNNEEFRFALGTTGLERVLNNFTNLKIAEQTLLVYERVISSEGRRDNANRRVSVTAMSGV